MLRNLDTAFPPFAPGAPVKSVYERAGFDINKEAFNYGPNPRKASRSNRTSLNESIKSRKANLSIPTGHDSGHGHSTYSAASSDPTSPLTEDDGNYQNGLKQQKQKIQTLSSTALPALNHASATVSIPPAASYASNSSLPLPRPSTAWRSSNASSIYDADKDPIRESLPASRYQTSPMIPPKSHRRAVPQNVQAESFDFGSSHNHDTERYSAYESPPVSTRATEYDGTTYSNSSSHSTHSHYDMSNGQEIGRAYSYSASRQRKSYSETGSFDDDGNRYSYSQSLKSHVFSGEKNGQLSHKDDYSHSEQSSHDEKQRHSNDDKSLSYTDGEKSSSYNLGAMSSLPPYKQNSHVSNYDQESYESLYHDARQSPQASPPRPKAYDTSSHAKDDLFNDSYDKLGTETSYSTSQEHFPTRTDFDPSANLYGPECDHVHSSGHSSTSTKATSVSDYNRSKSSREQVLPLVELQSSPADHPLSASEKRASRKHCRGCGQRIVGKCVSAKDGQITGRWHRNCFACVRCNDLLGSEFYVLSDSPYCYQCYHEENNSICPTCGLGIEGKCLESCSVDGSLNLLRYHPQCLCCAACGDLINQDEYYAVEGVPFCSQHRSSTRGTIDKRKSRIMFM